MAVIGVAAFPRDDNPYQRHLAAALQDHGVTVHYLAWPTRSHTLNLLLLPVQLIRARHRGVHVLHLHWVYPFVVPGLPPSVGRPLMGLWFTVFLRTARLAGIRLVWTAHNVLPHRQVFTDDRRRRQQLLDATDAVVVHSAPAEQALRDHGLRLPHVVLAPHGRFDGYRERLIDRRDARADLGIDPRVPVVLFFGRITGYKGVTDLVSVWPAVLDAFPDAVLLVAGACENAVLRAEIEQAARALGPSVMLRLAQVPDETIPVLFSAADLTCLPFRHITTSGSAVLAAGLGRLLIPALDTLSTVTGPSVTRYPPGTDGLRRGLVHALSAARNQSAPAAIADDDGAPAWSVAAEAHAALYRQLHAGVAGRPPRTKGADVASA